MHLAKRILLCWAVILGTVSIGLSTAADASGWSSYFQRCKPILQSRWLADYGDLYNALKRNNAGAVVNDADTLEALGTFELSCANSSDQRLNSLIQSLTYFQTVAMTDVKTVITGSISSATVAGAINKMTSVQLEVVTQLDAH